MAGSRGSPGKKTARKRKPKPKVRLDVRKVATLAAAVVTVCLLLLVVFGLSLRPKDAPALSDASVPSAASPSAGTDAMPSVPQEKQEGSRAETPAKPAEPEKTAAPAKPAESRGSSPKAASSAPSASPAKSPSGSSPSEAGSAAKPDAQSAPVPASPKAAERDSSPEKPAAAEEKPRAEEKPPFDIPAAKNGATLVFVIDDAGLSVANVRKYTELPFPLTIAVLPKLSHSKDCAWVVRSSGKELILHQPMQSVNLAINPGEGAITPGMSGSEIEATLRENIAEIGPGVKGFNNHEGSLITEDLNKMTFVLGTAKSEGVYFLDSRTTANSAAPRAALEHDMEIFERNAPFLDNTLTREAMLTELYKGLAVANRDGVAVIIGHVDKSAGILPALLSDIYPYLVEKGYRLSTLSGL